MDEKGDEVQSNSSTEESDGDSSDSDNARNPSDESNAELNYICYNCKRASRSEPFRFISGQ